MVGECVHCDSRSIIRKAQTSMYNSKSRHIHQRHNIIKHLLSNEIIFIDYVKSKKNIMYPLTKSLSKEFVYIKPLKIKEWNGW